MEAPKAPGQQIAPEVQQSIRAEGSLPAEAAGGGAGSEQLAQANDQLQEHVGRTVALVTMKANQVAVAAAAGQMNQAATTALYGDDKTPGFLASKGADAIQGYADVVPNLKSNMDKIVAGLANDDQKRMALREYDSQLDMANKQVHSHLEQQIQVHAADVAQGTVKTAIDSAARAVGSPAQADAIQQAKELVQNTIWQHGVIQNGDSQVGVDPSGHKTVFAGEATQARIDEAVSTLHLNVLDAMQSNGDAMGAKKYLEENEKEINPVQAKAVAKNIDTDVDKQEAGSVAAQILQKHADNRGDALTATENLDDKLRPEARRIISEHFQDQKETEDANLQQKQDAAYKYIQQTGQMPPAQSVDGLDTAPLERYRQKLRNGTAQNTDNATFQSLRDMAGSGDVKDQNDFMHENLLDYRDKLNDTDLKSLQNAQQALRKKNPQAMSDVNNWRQQTQVANETLRDIGMDPGMAKDPQVVQFKKDLDDHIGFEQAQSKQPLGRDQIQKIAQRLATNVVLDSGQREPLFQALKQSSPFTVQPQDIPAADRARVVDLLKQSKLPVNDLNVSRLYTLSLKKGGYGQ